MSSDLARERALRPIYHHLDTYHYSKALKLTYAKPQCEWPITIALRAHCLERSGKTLDACREIRILVSSLSNVHEEDKNNSPDKNSSDWSELDATIWMLGLGSEGETSSVGTATDSTTSASSTSNPTTSSSRGKGKKGKSKASANSKTSTTSNATTSSTCNVANKKSPLDMIHVLDYPNYKLQQMLSSSKFVEESFAFSKSMIYNPNDIADEVSIVIIYTDG